MIKEIEFEYSEEFEKNIKSYFKKYRTIKDDLEIFKELLRGRFCEINISNKGETINIREIISKHINILYEEENLKQSISVIKERLAVKSLSNQGKTFRIIYIYCQNINNTKDKIIFIEMYYKGDKENEDKELILERIDLVKQNH